MCFLPPFLAQTSTHAPIPQTHAFPETPPLDITLSPSVDFPPDSLTTSLDLNEFISIVTLNSHQGHFTAEPRESPTFVGVDGMQRFTEALFKASGAAIAKEAIHLETEIKSAEMKGEKTKQD